MLHHRRSRIRIAVRHRALRLLVLPLIIGLVVGCTGPAKPAFPTPLPPLGAPVPPPATVKPWSGAPVTAICLDVQLDFPTNKDGAIPESLDTFVRSVLETMPVEVHPKGGECGATMVIDATGVALAGDYVPGGRRYTGVKITGLISLKGEGMAGQALGLNIERKPSKTISLSEGDHSFSEPYLADFRGAWFEPVMGYLERLWGPRVWVGGLAAAMAQRAGYAERLAAAKTDPAVVGDLIAAVAVSKDAGLREFAIDRISRFAGTPEYDAALPYIVRALVDEDWLVRDAARDALPRYGDRALAFVPTMIHMLGDETLAGDKTYLGWALTAVTGVGGFSFADQWQQWWLDNQQALEARIQAAASAPAAITPDAPATEIVVSVVSTTVLAASPEPAPTEAPTAPPGVVTPTTPAPTATAPAYAPVAKLLRHSPAGKCRWDVYISLSGFAPNSKIVVTSDYSEVECATGKVVRGGHWQEPYDTKTDTKGRLIVAYLHEAWGDYLYTFRDDKGNVAQLPFSTLAEMTPQPGQSAPAATAPPPAGPPTAPPPTRAAIAVDPQAVVKGATLNLRGGPGQNYPAIGQVDQGTTLYPLRRVGDCAWLQVGVLGRQDLVWVAGGPQYVTLNVPCAQIAEFDGDLPTPVPTAVPAPPRATRPPTGLLSSAGSLGSGFLEIKNGTDTDGVVILVSALGVPVQAAYIRAGDSFRMTSIADGNYRLYFTKGVGWDKAQQQFTSNVVRQRFDDTLAYGPTTAGYEVTLYGVAGGNAGTENVPAGQFPALP